MIDLGIAAAFLGVHRAEPSEEDHDHFAPVPYPTFMAFLAAEHESLDNIHATVVEPPEDCWLRGLQVVARRIWPSVSGQASSYWILESELIYSGLVVKEAE